MIKTTNQKVFDMNLAIEPKEAYTVDRDLISDELAVQKASYDLMREAQKNLNGKTVNAYEREEAAELEYSALAEDVKASAEIISELQSEIKELRMQVASAKSSGNSEAVNDYNRQLAETLADYRELTQEHSYLVEDMKEAFNNYSQARKEVLAAEKNLQRSYETRAARDNKQAEGADIVDLFSKKPEVFDISSKLN